MMSNGYQNCIDRCDDIGLILYCIVLYCMYQFDIMVPTGMHCDLQTENELLNEPIAHCEVENAIHKLKLDNASGIDMVKNTHNCFIPFICF